MTTDLIEHVRDWLDRKRDASDTRRRKALSRWKQSGSLADYFRYGNAIQTYKRWYRLAFFMRYGRGDR